MADPKPQDLPYKTNPMEHSLDDFDLNDTKDKESQVVGTVQDDNPFGDETGSGVKFRTMSWWQCGMLMIAENISLGVLSLPSAVDQLGLAPAIVIIVFMSAVAWYTGYTLGQFKARYPHVHSMSDAGEILLGRVGRETLEVGQLLFMIFLMASHVLTFSEAMNTITNHGTCTIVFTIVSLVICVIATIPRTMSMVFWMCVASALSIVTAVIVTMISIGVQSPGVQVEAAREISLYKAFLAVTNIVFAYIAHVAFFGFISEMEQPKHFPRSLAMLQVTDTILYLVTGIVCYCYFGPGIESPALGSAGHIMKKVAYGIALPTIIVSGVVYGHVSCKYVYVRLLRGTGRMHENSFFAIGTWLGIDVIVWLIAWIIAESIPVFSYLLSLVSSIFGSWFSYGLPAVFWLYMHRQSYFASARNIFLTIVNVTIFGIACTICGLGLYVSGRAIHESTGGASWSCADNSS